MRDRLRAPVLAGAGPGQAEADTAPRAGAAPRAARAPQDGWGGSAARPDTTAARTGASPWRTRGRGSPAGVALPVLDTVPLPPLA